MELNLKPSDSKLRDYYSALYQFGQLNISHEAAARQAFASLLHTCGKQFQWKLVPEFLAGRAGRFSQSSIVCLQGPRHRQTWAWYVQGTHKVTKEDFDLVTRTGAGAVSA